MNSDSIPIDLIIEILWRLPAKSIARFNCVSKQWASILGRPYFTELFLTRSSAQPRLLFTIEGDGVWSFFSVPQHQKSLVVAAEFHLKFPPDNMRIYSTSHVFNCGHASGLIYFYHMNIKGEEDYGLPVICNPNTGRYVSLPFLDRHSRNCESFFGFDPINKQFKVLFMGYPGCDGHRILTLGSGKMWWRNIKCPLVHDPLNYIGICINGVLYYLGDHKDYLRSDVVDGIDETFAYVIVCFDVRFEKFKFIGVENYCQLIKYKGKLGVVYREDDDVEAIELRLWVLEDAEKQEWSKYAYTLWDDKFVVENKYVNIHVVGVTATGEIILSMGYYISKQPFYVFYFNPERNTLQSVEIQGFGEYHHDGRRSSVYTFVNHVEDLNVNNAKLLNSSIYAPYVKKEELEDEEEQENEKEMKRKRI